MKRNRKIFGLRIEDIWFDTNAFKKSNSPITILHTPTKIKEKGIIALNEKTFYIDLTKPTEEIFEGFDKKSKRYAIKKAEKDGVDIRLASNSEEIEKFYQFFSKFAQAKKIPQIEKKELENYDIFYALSINKNYLGGCAFIKSNDKSIYRYKHGATSYQYNENNILIWKAIQYAKEQGYLIFDLGGVKIVEDKNSDYYKHYQFKEKFGGKIVDFYSYIKIKQPILFLTIPFRLGVQILFNGDYNGATNFLYKIKILK